MGIEGLNNIRKKYKGNINTIFYFTIEDIIIKVNTKSDNCHIYAMFMCLKKIIGIGNSLTRELLIRTMRYLKFKFS